MESVRTTSLRPSRQPFGLPQDDEARDPHNVRHGEEPASAGVSNHARLHPIASIHTAMAIIIRFSVSDTNPSGTLLSPPTQAHFSSRLSI